ncbi:MAG: SDR family oxidoreductase [Deltaproteobacteria bacterium]|nr:SDR family oxidoreductase [Deltaproteobacteria bacterium]
MATALITGASAGIGYALSRCFAADHHDLILVARQEQKLRHVAEELHREFQVSTHVIAADLAQADAPRKLADAVQANSLTVDFLVNNAGFGLGGKFTETALATELEMVQVNIVSLVYLTKLFLPAMVERKSGRIMNVASTAAFQPGPFMAVYYATKAFVLSFSEAIGNELSGTGVTVTALCPGPTASDFQARANIQETRLVKSKLMGFMSTEAVAQVGYRGLMSGKRVVVPGVMNKLGVQGTRVLPRRLSAQIARMLQENA